MRAKEMKEENIVYTRQRSMGQKKSIKKMKLKKFPFFAMCFFSTPSHRDYKDDGPRNGMCCYTVLYYPLVPECKENKMSFSPWQSALKA